MKCKLDLNNQIIERILKLEKLEWIRFFSFILVFPLLIVGLQFVLFYVIIPLNVSPDFIMLNIKNPTISGMFFSNYVHSINDSGHLMSNYFSTIFCMFIIAMMIFILMPAYNIKISSQFIYGVFFLIFCILPFVISVTTLFFSQITGSAHWAVGFSGITYGLMGFGIFLFLWFVYEIYLKNIDANNSRKTIFELILISLLLCLVPLWVMLSEIGGQINVFGHMIGYSFGLIIPLIIGLSEKSENLGI